MASQPKSFDELLDETPPSAPVDTISVVGLISRAASLDKFVLTTADGQTLTLDRKAVKGYAVLGGSVGQQIVRIDLDHTQLPADTLKVAGPSSEFGSAQFYTVQTKDIPVPVGPGGGYTFFYLDHYFTYGHLDVGLPTVATQSATAQPDIAPFVAAFPHQASPSTMAALALSSGPRTYFSPYDWAADQHYVYKARADQPY